MRRWIKMFISGVIALSSVTAHGQLACNELFLTQDLIPVQVRSLESYLSEYSFEQRNQMVQDFAKIGVAERLNKISNMIRPIKIDSELSANDRNILKFTEAALLSHQFDLLFPGLKKKSANTEKLRNAIRISIKLSLNFAALYYFHIPLTIPGKSKLVNYRALKIDNPLLDYIEAVGFEKALPYLRTHFGRTPNIDKALNSLRVSFVIAGIFFILFNFYDFFQNGGREKIEGFWAFITVDPDAVKKEAKALRNSGEWVNVNLNSWIEYVQSVENRTPTAKEIELKTVELTRTHNKLLQKK